MPTIDTKIWMAIRQYVETLTNPLPIAWPDESFSPPESGYLRVSFIPNTSFRRSINSDGKQQVLSLLQLDVFLPANQRREVYAEAAGKIADQFPTDLRLVYEDVSLRVRRRPTVVQELLSGPFIMTAVMIDLETFI